MLHRITLTTIDVRMFALIVFSLGSIGCDNASELNDSIDRPTEAIQGGDESIAVNQIDNVGETPTASGLDAGSFDYENLVVPAYIQRNNSRGSVITNAGAALGRVLFYDTSLSTNNEISCSSCHQQSAGFSDSRAVSEGVNGSTARHSMRLVNVQFSDEENFFWDERAESLEDQVTQPIHDFIEMGFSGTDGAADFEALITKLSGQAYYTPLFTQAFGNSVITEERIQSALSQFIRSIQSFDSRYDQGRVQVQNDDQPFPNFTDIENEGKRLFMDRPVFNPTTGERRAGTGLGCNQCHQPPEFSIDDNSRNNGVISVAGNIMATDVENTRSPTLRDLFDFSGVENGPFMHDGSLTTFNAVLDHYNDIVVDRQLNNNLDNRLNGTGPNGNNANAPGQKLLLTEGERGAVHAFMKTLSGDGIYHDPRWSDPFDDVGGLTAD